MRFESDPGNDLEPRPGVLREAGTALPTGETRARSTSYTVARPRTKGAPERPLVGARQLLEGFDQADVCRQVRLQGDRAKGGRTRQPGAHCSYPCDGAAATVRLLRVPSRKPNLRWDTRPVAAVVSAGAPPSVPIEETNQVICHFGSWRRAREALDLSATTTARKIEARFRARRLGKVWRYTEDTLRETLVRCGRALRTAAAGGGVRVVARARARARPCPGRRRPAPAEPDAVPQALGDLGGGAAALRLHRG